MRIRSVQAAIGSVALSSFTMIGAAYAFYGRDMGTLGGWDELLVWMLLIAIVAVPYALALQTLFSRNYSRGNVDSPTGIAGFLCRHAGFGSFALLLLSVAPYLWVYYPGSVPNDGYDQLNMAVGLEPYTNSHPVFSTLVIRLPYLVGARLSSNFGVFCCTCCFALYACAVFAYTVRRITRLALPWSASLFALAFFALVPTWGFFAQTLLKDTG